MRFSTRLLATAGMGIALFSCAEQDHSELRSQLREGAPLKNLASSRKLDPTVLQAVQHLKDNQYKEASHLINRALQEEPANAALHILNGMAYEKLAKLGDAGQLDLAIVGYESALNIDPNNMLALTRLAQLQYKKREFDRSQELFANALLIKPNDTALLHELAAASYYAYDLKTAQAAIQKVVEKQPEDLLAQRSATMIYAALGDFKTANQHFSKYNELAGDDPDVARVTSRLKDWKKLYSSGRIHLAQDSGGSTFDPFQSPDGDSTGDTEPQISGLAGQALSRPLAGDSDDSDGGSDGGDSSGSSSNGGGSGSGNGAGTGSTNGTGPGTGSKPANGNGSGNGTETGSANGASAASANGAGPGTGIGNQHSASTQTASSALLYDEDEQLIVDCYLLRIFESASSSKGNNILRNLEVSLSPGGYLFGSGRTSGSGTITRETNVSANGPGNTNSFAPGPTIASLDENGQPAFGSFMPTMSFGNSGRMSFSTFAAALTWRGLSYNLNIANVTDSRTEVVARPSLLTFVGKESVFFSGNELVIGLSGENGSNLIKYPVGITLVVKPSSLEDGIVTLDISVEGGEFNGPNALQQDLTQTVSVGKTRIDTHAKVKLGETLALGGIYERAEAQSKDGFPGLSAIPIAQYFFSNEQTQTTRRSVVILMTPRTPTKTRRALEKRMSDQSDPPSLSEFKDRHMDWFDTAPNLVKIFSYLSVDPIIYYSMQNADILPPSWGEPDTHYNDNWNKALSFLYY